jgi:FixJ family two-component response regulator
VTASDATVYIVDDDPAVREAVSSLLRSTGLCVVEFASARSYLDDERDAEPSCLVLDVRMPGMSGLDLQRELARRGVSTPIVFISGHGDIPMAVTAMKQGAVEFLPKPFREHDLLDAVWAAVRRDEQVQQARVAIGAIRARYETLTERERDVLEPIVAGRLNKQVGASLGVSEQTVKVHRHNIMRKMEAPSLPDLVRMIEALRGDEPSATPTNITSGRGSR